jgi:hypothetical protein
MIKLKFERNKSEVKMNKYRNMHKIIKVFHSCETYAQWNNAYAWFLTIRQRIFNGFDQYEITEEVNTILLKKELRE